MIQRIEEIIREGWGFGRRITRVVGETLNTLLTIEAPRQARSQQLARSLEAATLLARYPRTQRHQRPHPRLEAEVSSFHLADLRPETSMRHRLAVSDCRDREHGAQ